MPEMSLNTKDKTSDQETMLATTWQGTRSIKVVEYPKPVVTDPVSSPTVFCCMLRGKHSTERAAATSALTAGSCPHPPHHMLAVWAGERAQDVLPEQQHQLVHCMISPGSNCSKLYLPAARQRESIQVSVSRPELKL